MLEVKPADAVRARRWKKAPAPRPLSLPSGRWFVAQCEACRNRVAYIQLSRSRTVARVVSLRPAADQYAALTCPCGHVTQSVHAPHCEDVLPEMACEICWVRVPWLTKLIRIFEATYSIRWACDQCVTTHDRVEWDAVVVAETRFHERLARRAAYAAQLPGLLTAWREVQEWDLQCRRLGLGRVTPLPLDHLGPDPFAVPLPMPAVVHPITTKSVRPARTVQTRTSVVGGQTVTLYSRDGKRWVSDPSGRASA